MSNEQYNDCNPHSDVDPLTNAGMLQVPNDILCLGFRCVFDKECMIELRIEGANPSGNIEHPEAGEMESIRLRVLMCGEDKRYTRCRVEASSESDLFFYYSCELDEATFREMASSQRLMIEFRDYVSVVVKMITQCLNDPQQFMAVMTTSSKGPEARLEFVQNMEYKFIELLSVHLSTCSDKYVKQMVIWKYTQLKTRNAALQSRMTDLVNLVKIKSPSILLQLQKKVLQQQQQQRSHAAIASNQGAPGSHAAGVSSAPKGGPSNPLKVQATR